jgi:hypothetical protein
LKPISRTLLAAAPILTALAITLPLGADAQVKEARRVSNYATATCKSWVNSVSATVVCQDTAYNDLPAGTCVSSACNAGSGVAKFADGEYEGAFDNSYPGKGFGRLKRTDGVIVEGNFRRGEYWQVTAYFPDGIMWKGTVASETGQNAFGTWSAYRDSGGTRAMGVIRYGSLFAKPTAAQIADGRARLAGNPGAKPAPKAPGKDLTAIVARSKGLTAVTTGEHAMCWALYIAMSDAVPNYGRMGLPETFSPEAVAKRVKAWEKMTKAAYKKQGRSDWAGDVQQSLTEYRNAYDLGNLDLIDDMAGVCIADPTPS